MSWLTRLYQTYEAAQALDLPQSEQIMPICHTPQNAHIHITINEQGEFLRASVLEKTQIILPATEESAGRAGSKPPPHPLCDKLQYVAADYKAYGGAKPSFYDKYCQLLDSWVSSSFTHLKARAVYRYIRKGRVMADLIAAGICFADDDEQLLTSWQDSEQPQPLLFKMLPKEKGHIEQGSALVCWSVECVGDKCPETWKDRSLQQAWIDFDIHNGGSAELCLVTGKEAAAAVNHPAKIRHTGDKAKLISSNDKSGYTFRGRFFDSHQAANVSFEVTQKAHNTLRWLIERQGYRNGEQVIVAWAVKGSLILQPMEDPELEEQDYDTFEAGWGWGDDDLAAQVISSSPDTPEVPDRVEHTRDLGQRFGHLFRHKLKGSHSAVSLTVTDTIVVMGLDSATPGRMGITYYRDFLSYEYLSNLEAWHRDCAWWQRASKEKQEAGKPKWYRCAPSTWAILQAVYGDIIKSNESLKKNLSERLLPCITERRSIPVDMMRRATQRAAQRHSFKIDEQWQWEQNLGVACALYRGYAIRQLGRKYAMALETDNHSRDYLYGRLLAIAENVEQFALDKAGEKRLTNAARLMQRFADRPFSTWKTIELSLQPYWHRLQGTYGGFVYNRKKALDEVLGAFDSESFSSDKALSAEFLLGFHSQRLELMVKKAETELTEQE
ncbi:CRISPR-associated protein, Csd1 family [Photobacterium marinum]|uniref:CRISPR-associated protein, Csd1 family n=1 Tax=Photobacterium marinum TaxID=1056511 RepID=L8JAY5_9GAMM|nr:type I-C CRISPR-associated protein Cas8c/Csd1 [Photobacterium marinum]ELR65961.1 CRISPR-associated protein, Csd1 family [Photobacterium marinum]